MQNFNSGSGPQQITPIRGPHLGAQHEQERPETLPPRRKSPERGLDERPRGALLYPCEQTLDPLYGLEGALGELVSRQAAGTLRDASFRGGW